jgi:hypothetical protein
MKDFYAILGLTPMSTREEIRKQYRKLAKQYHPDTHPGDAYAAAMFQDVKEAYETLTQPARKEEWLRERWLRQATHQGQGETAPLTPFSLLEKVLRFERSVSRMDVFRMDHQGVVNTAKSLLSSENLECLEKFHEADMNRTIIRHLLLALDPVPFSHTQDILGLLDRLAGQDPESRRMISGFRQSHARKQRAGKWTFPLVLLATLLICFLIWLGSR